MNSSITKYTSGVRVACLGSGSKGNATLYDFSGQYILVDCGFGPTELTRRLSPFNLQISDIDAVFITHEHGDHIGGLAAVIKKLQCPVYMSSGTHIAWSKPRSIPSLVYMRDRQGITLDKLAVMPVSVPHDAREPLQLVFNHQGYRVGHITDLGSITPHIIRQYQQVNLLYIEANHDVDMLRFGHYPASLKKRVLGNWGHLNNQQSVEFILTLLKKDMLRHVLVGHLSEKNNCTELVTKLFSTHFHMITCHILQQKGSHDWLIAD